MGDEKGFGSRAVVFVTVHRIEISFIVVIAVVVSDVFCEGVVPQNLVASVWGKMGLALVIAGVGLRSWAAGIIHKNSEVATEGPYALVRHPLYAGSALIAAGYSFILADADDFVVAGLLIVLLYVPKILSEEAHMAEKFREQWPDYKKRTGMVLPKRPRVRALFGDWSLKRWARNREYRAFSMSLIMLAVLDLWRRLGGTYLSS